MQALAAQVVTHVERAKRSIDEEIARYPTPIPRCDVQFNFLYEQRARLAQWLTEAHAAPLDGEVSHQACIRMLQRFAALAAIAETREEAGLRTRVADALAELRAQP